MNYQLPFSIDKIYISQINDPFLNLAFEEFLFKNLKFNERILYLYINSPCLVMGKFQNPWLEINTAALKKKGKIPVLRRISGGGCVYHDMGNLNYSFITNTENWLQKEQCDFVVHVLSKFMIEAFVSDKFDILVNVNEQTKKISGSAFKKSRLSHIHHGTLLIDSNLSQLRELLQKTNKIIESKSIPSRPHSVTNLKELNSIISTKDIIHEIIKSVSKNSEIEKVFEIDPQDFLKDIQENFLRLQSHNWTYLETPKFNHLINCELSWGIESLRIESLKGLITEVAFERSQLNHAITESISTDLVGIEYNEDLVSKKILSLVHKYAEFESEIHELAASVHKNLT